MSPSPAHGHSRAACHRPPARRVPPRVSPYPPVPPFPPLPSLCPAIRGAPGTVGGRRFRGAPGRGGSLGRGLEGGAAAAARSPPGLPPRTAPGAIVNHRGALPGPSPSPSPGLVCLGRPRLRSGAGRGGGGGAPCPPRGSRGGDASRRASPPLLPRCCRRKFGGGRGRRCPPGRWVRAGSGRRRRSLGGGFAARHGAGMKMKQCWKGVSPLAASRAGSAAASSGEPRRNPLRPESRVLSVPLHPGAAGSGQRGRLGTVHWGLSGERAVECGCSLLDP